MQRTVEQFQLTVADGEAIDQDELSRVLAQSLSEIVNRSVNLALVYHLDAFLLPEFDAAHVFDERFEGVSVHKRHWHGELLSQIRESLLD